MVVDLDQTTLRALVHHLPLPALLCSRQGSLLETNESWKKLTGYLAGEFPSLASVAELAIPGDFLMQTQFIHHLLEAKHENPGRTFPFRTRANGNLLLSLSSSAVSESCVLMQAVPVKSAPAASDTAEIVERLVQTESTISSFFETSPFMMGIVETRPDDLIFESVNPAVAQFLGRSVKELRGRRFSELFFEPKDVASWIKGCLKTEEQRRAHRFEYKFDKGGKTLWFAGAVNFLGKNSTGQSRVSFTLLDITERKFHERDLEFINDVTAALTSSLDFRGSIQVFARRSLARLGDTCLVDVVENDSITRVAVASSIPEVQINADSILRKYPLRPDRPHLSVGVIRTGKSVLHSHIPDELIQKVAYDSEHLEMIRSRQYKSILTVPIRAQDKILGAATFLTSRRIYDESDLALAENLGCRAGLALENSRLFTRAQEAISLREDFLGIVSHDLKNPLSSIRLNAELISRFLGKPNANPAFNKKAVARIEETVGQMNRLIEQLLDIGRIESRGLAVECDEHSISQILEQVIDMLRPIGQEKSVQLTAEMSECMSELSIFCDHDRVMQIFSNLIGNAFKFAPPGSAVQIHVSREQDAVRFSVSNSGPGIPLDHLGRIFERYWQAPETRRQGSGLGLYIVKGIVDAHGGRIWAESDASSTTLNFTLPVRKAGIAAISDTSPRSFK